MYFHITPTKNLPQIFQTGLVPAKGPRSIKMNEQHNAVYLFPTLDDAENAWMNWLGEELEDDGEVALLEVKLPANALFIDSAGYELAVSSVIEASLVQVLSEDLDNFDWQSPSGPSLSFG